MRSTQHRNISVREVATLYGVVLEMTEFGIYPRIHLFMKGNSTCSVIRKDYKMVITDDITQSSQRLVELNSRLIRHIIMIVTCLLALIAA